MLVTQPVDTAAYDNLLDRASTASCASSVVNHFQFDDALILCVDEMVNVGIKHSFFLNDVIFAQVPCDVGVIVFSVFANCTKIAPGIPVGRKRRSVIIVIRTALELLGWCSSHAWSGGLPC